MNTKQPLKFKTPVDAKHDKYWYILDGNGIVIAHVKNDNFKDSIVLAINNHADLTTRVTELEAAMEKSDPWKDVGDIVEFRWKCIHCGQVYNMVASIPDESHAPDCIWLSAHTKRTS
jgi:hypothetical protein